MQQSSLNCTIHPRKAIIGACISQKCQMMRSCCFECVKQFHSDHIHDVIELESLNIQMKQKSKSKKILAWIQEIQSLVQIIKDCFESLLSENNVDDFTNSQSLHDFISSQINSEEFNMDLVQNNYQSVKKSLQDLSQSIFRTGSLLENQNGKLQQIKLLITEKGLSESLQMTKNFILKQKGYHTAQEGKSKNYVNQVQQLMTCVFDSIIVQPVLSQNPLHPLNLQFGSNIVSTQYLQTNEFHFGHVFSTYFYLKSQDQNRFTQKSNVISISSPKQKYSFSSAFTPNNIKLLENNTMAIQLEDRNESTNMIAVCDFNLEKNKITTLKFNIVKLKWWVGIGVCHKTVINNKKAITWDKVNHGQNLYLLSLYMISKRKDFENPHSWSHIDEKINQQEVETFQLQEKDTIVMAINPLHSVIEWFNEKTGQNFSMKLKTSLDLCVCVGLYRVDDSVKIINQ